MQKDSWAHQQFVHESHSLQTIPGFLSRTDGMASRICVELLPHYYQIIIRWNRPKGYTTILHECPNLRFAVLLTLAALGAGKLPELGQQFRNRTVANGHIVKEPAEQSTGIDHVVEEFLTGDVLVVNRGVTGGNTKCQTILSQQPHGICNFIINALAPAGIVGFCKTFQRNGGDKVLHPQHFLLFSAFQYWSSDRFEPNIKRQITFVIGQRYCLCPIFRQRKKLLPFGTLGIFCPLSNRTVRSILKETAA